MKTINYESASFLILATDETDALIKTVKSLMEICNEEDIDKYVEQARRTLKNMLDDNDQIELK